MKLEIISGKDKFLIEDKDIPVVKSYPRWTVKERVHAMLKKVPREGIFAKKKDVEYFIPPTSIDYVRIKEDVLVVVEEVVEEKDIATDALESMREEQV